MDPGLQLFALFYFFLKIHLNKEINQQMISVPVVEASFSREGGLLKE